ncbi:MAG: NTP transferase domain-containing protein [Desulfobulbaceae bacterium]|nr:NTP transferase domain-containing protein [Desulfobulbaceae bacterium]
MNNLTALILAAGKGTRMKSAKAKVLHEVFFRPMIHHVMDAVSNASVNKTVVIVGHQHDWVVDSLKEYSYTPVIQEEQLGTGHAVLCAEEACAHADAVLILCGDTPLIRPETLDAMIEHHRNSGAILTLMTTLVANPYGYGRVLSDTEGNVTGIVEEKDADHSQRRINEINAGIYLADRSFLFQALKQVGTDNSQGEVYLTDIVAIANRENKQVNPFRHETAIDVLGVNSRVELAEANRELQKRRNEELMLSGVTMYSPESIYVEQGIPVGMDTVIHPGVRLTGNTKIGVGCILEPGVFLHDCIVNNNGIIGAWSTLHNWEVQPSEYIFPRTIRVEKEPSADPPSRCRSNGIPGL